VLVLIIPWLLKIAKRYKADETLRLDISWLIKSKNLKVAFLLFLLSFSFNTFTYINQRIEWMGEDNGNLTAKEYYVAGQVVYANRMIVHKFIFPDRLIARPLYLLQKTIYDRGIKYLPKNDGERGIWADLWFVYLYSHRNGAPMGTRNDRLSPQMVALLDLIWSNLEIEATGTFVDRQMEIQHYYRNFPGQAFYYYLNKGYYGVKWGSEDSYTRDPKQIDRSRKLARWLEELEGNWRTSKETLKFLNKHPKVVVLQQAVRIMELGDIITNDIVTDRFSCKNDTVKKYLFERKRFIDGDGKEKPAYKRMREKKQAKTVYNVVVNIRTSLFKKFLLNRYCGLIAAGEEDLSSFEGYGPSVEEMMLENFNSVFKEEMQHLEEWENERLRSKKNKSAVKSGSDPDNPFELR